MSRVNIGRKYAACLLIMFLTWVTAYGQKIDAFVTVQMSPAKVVVKQPIKVKITAYSSTWFAEPLDFQNVQIPDAFILSFSRTLSGIHYIDGKKYAGLEFFFLVFPYSAGEYSFPELEIKTSIPPEGDYVGQPVTLRSKSRAFTVEEIPGGESAPDLVAKQVYISDKWSKSLDEIKVGDVITRTITINAKGTLPSFIPPIEITDPAFASIYGKTAQQRDDRDDKDANGRRIEEFAYLFEKEGSFTIPPVNVSWWNPYVKRKYEKEIAGIEIDVKENEDLDLLSSLKDSLNQANNLSLPEQEDDNPTWKDYVNSGLKYVVALLVLIFIWWIGKKQFRIWHRKRQTYLKSEKYYYHLLRKNPGRENLYRWYDQFRMEFNYPAAIRTAIPDLDVENIVWDKDLERIRELREKVGETTVDKTYSYAINP